MSKKNKDTKSLRIKFSVKKSPDEVFSVIKDVKGWWIGDVSGKADQVGDSFRYAYKTFHDTTQEMIELIPNKKIVWEVTKSAINFVKDKNEWLSTKLVFELIKVKDGTEVHFTHEGLTPQIECYENCSAGWEHYISKSLKSFITNGEGIDPKF